MSLASKRGTVALIVRYSEAEVKPVDGPVLIETLSDDHEIAIFEAAQKEGQDPLAMIYERREKQLQEDEEFADYVEELLSQPFLKAEIQFQGIQWLKSKIKIEEYQKKESDATKVIAEYAYKIFENDQKKRDFILEGPTAQVRIKVLEIRQGDTVELKKAEPRVA